jgi:cyclase
MRKLSTFQILLILALFAGSPKPLNDQSKHFTIQQIAPGVWAAINNDQYGHAICNAGIIDLGDKTLIFDPFMNIDAANDLKKVAEDLTHRQANIIINSHYHNDHIRGNQVFGPATIISSLWTRNQIAISEPQELAWEKENAAQRLVSSRRQLDTATGMLKDELPLWIGYFEGMVSSAPLIKTTLPNMAFSDSLWIYGTSRNIKLLEFKNGHTASDVVLIIPDCGAVFMGDLLFVKRHPWLGDGISEKWIQHLQNISNDNELKLYLPGHGPVAGRAEMNTMILYLSSLRKLVHAELEQQRPDSLIQKSAMPAEFAGWKFQSFFAPNLGHLCKEMRAK